MPNAKMSPSIQQEQPLVSLVLDAIEITTQLSNEVKKQDFTAADWAPLEALVAVNEFTWMSPDYEKLKWHEYIVYLTEWAQAMSWKSTIKRIHQWQNIVYLEHEVRSTFGDTVDISCSVAVYEFNDQDKINRLAIYLQHKPSLGL
jgi:hypothetical protein